jgi:phage-related protein
MAETSKMVSSNRTMRKIKKTKRSQCENSVELKNTVDGKVEKTKLSIYEDGSNEVYLKMIKEFQNYVDTYSIWNEDNAGRTVYLAGTARDLWYQINELDRTKKK